MSEIDKASELSEPPISPEILERFSKGDIQLGEGMTIQGEDKERKIIITITPDDPDYLDYKKRLRALMNVISIVQLPENYMTEPEDGVDIGTRRRRSDKQDLSHNIFTRELDAFFETNRENFLKRCDEIPKGGSTERLFSEVIDFLNLISYAKYLEGRNAFEVILPEQQTHEPKPQE